MVRAPLPVAVAVSALMLASCGGDDSGSGEPAAVPEEPSPTIAAATVEAQVAADLTGMGLEPDGVACPEGIATAAGSTSRCEIEVLGRTIGATVEVESSRGGEALLRVTVDDEPG